jgi:hypothetical protein
VLSSWYNQTIYPLIYLQYIIFIKIKNLKLETLTMKKIEFYNFVSNPAY